MKDRLIVLVGFMGSGKTAVAEQLARLRNESFVDLDGQIELAAGRTPAQIISEEGEEAFREKETDALRELLAGRERAIVALGGGAWTIDINRELVRSVGSVVIWLDAPFNVCWQRIAHDSLARPMAPSRPAAEKLYSERLPFYRMADFHIGVTVEAPEQVAENIAALLQHRSHT